MNRNGKPERVGAFKRIERRAPVCCLVLVKVLAVSAAPVALPPASNRAVDFDRDVQPILEQSCLRCHGAERPRSGFRLDNREMALKGGRLNSDDIVPGDSGRSRLIQYVSGADEEMMMPPPDKGEPLSAEQIGVLRAWIDQGASWGASEIFPERSAEATAALRWVSVSGDHGKFRELTGLREGFGGGVEHFRLEQRDAPDRRVTAEGHFLSPEEDFKLNLVWTRDNVGFVRAGFEHWTRFYDDSGGYFAGFSPPLLELDRDLALKVGRAWIDLGLTLPDRPKVVLGYEFQFRAGTKSMLEWGNVNGKNIYPATKAIDEDVHIVKLDVVHEVNGWRFEDNARVEFHNSQTRDQQAILHTTGPSPDLSVRSKERFTQVQGANTFRIEKQLMDWWLASGGYLYSRMDGDSTFAQTTVDAQNVTTFGTHWRSDPITLQREMHVASLASLLNPVDGLSVSIGGQAQFLRQEGFGNISLDVGDPGTPDQFFLQPAFVESSLDQTKFSEKAGLRYSQLPFTVLFAEAQLEQDAIGQFERQTGTPSGVFLRDTDYFSLRQDYRVGFNTSPWRWLALNAHLRHRDVDSDYDHQWDESPSDGEGYSAFIRGRETVGDDVETKLVLRPVSWLKTTLTYRRTDADYRIRTDPVTDPFFGNVSPGGLSHSGSSVADTFGLSATFAPSHRFYCSGTVLYSESRTVTGGNDVPFVAAYEGDTWSAIASANWSVNARLRLSASYVLSRSDFGQANPGGLSLGSVYTQHRLTAAAHRQLTDNLTAGLRYSFYHYEEASSRGFNDFAAHGLFASVSFRWP